MSQIKCREINPVPPKTYATKANMEKAMLRYPAITENADLSYMALQDAQGRWYPLFFGERSIRAGVHFAGFCIAG